MTKMMPLHATLAAIVLLFAITIVPFSSAQNSESGGLSKDWQSVIVIVNMCVGVAFLLLCCIGIGGCIWFWCRVGRGIRKQQKEEEMKKKNSQPAPTSSPSAPKLHKPKQVTAITQHHGSVVTAKPIVGQLIMKQKEQPMMITAKPSGPAFKALKDRQYQQFQQWQQQEREQKRELKNAAAHMYVPMSPSLPR